MKRDITVIKKRQKVWDIFGWGYRKEPNRLYKNHSLNCGCSMCRMKTFWNRVERRKDRREAKKELQNTDY